MPHSARDSSRSAGLLGIEIGRRTPRSRPSRQATPNGYHRARGIVGDKITPPSFSSRTSFSRLTTTRRSSPPSTLRSIKPPNDCSSTTGRPSRCCPHGEATGINQRSPRFTSWLPSNYFTRTAHGAAIPQPGDPGRAHAPENSGVSCFGGEQSSLLNLGALHGPWKGPATAG